MDPKVDPASSLPPHDPHAEVVAFLQRRSAPCPRCRSDLRGIRAARCPRCAEPLVLQIGSPRARFGWLVLAMVPGCFSGIAATFALIPVGGTLLRLFPPGQGAPWPIWTADAFGFLSAASVGVMYRRRQRILAWTARRQAAFAATIWCVHILAFAVSVLALAWVT